MSEQENIPHVENVDLVPETRSHGGAPGFSNFFQLNLALVIALSVLLLLSYFVFAAR